jgi:hypothetical protein
VMRFHGTAQLNGAPNNGKQLIYRVFLVGAAGFEPATSTV